MIARGKCKFPYGFFSIHENKLENASHRRHSPRAEVEEGEAHERLVSEVVEAGRGRIAYGLRDFVLALALDVPKPEDTRVVLVHLREHVVDFLDLRIWPVFNIADIAICGGVACMILAILFPTRFGGESKAGPLGRIEGWGGFRGGRYL